MGRRPRVTRDDVLAAARELFAERGYEAATLTAIAARLGVSPAALLRHAPTKDALFSAAMTSRTDTFTTPMDALGEVPGTAEPRAVLRELAFAFVPFLEERMGEVIVSWLRRQASSPSAPLSVFEEKGPTPPQRALALLTGWLKRASRAGRVSVRDPQAAALAFLASLQAYVFLHRLVKIADPPVPLPLYVETLLDVWEHGALRAPARRARARKKTR